MSARTPVTARLRTLAILELVNVALIGWLVFTVLRAPITAANAAGYLAAAFLLVVGSAYWFAKLHQLRGNSARPPGLAVFRVLRSACPVLLVVAAGIVGLGFDDSPRHVVPGLVLLALAIAEYVNYFHWQLMYDNPTDLRRLRRTRRLSRSHLALDLR
ncbi:hypothetical protein FB561_3772 [Kribbella amoyensis]|uniref:Uncharacterized protein n=1 Tax=Kribbella amoyensis TaxID=996641 RepID=A0A561BUR9_9ACTN|nr:multidrug transporter [Kribbella amoyensis]TWD82636.1 hypothetical protein FB561_3772 [Kribbella amoyensis]